MTPQKKKFLKLLSEWIYSIAIALLVATSIKSAIADWNDVPTGSMKPTILEGDRVFVNKLAYDLKIPYTTRQLARWKDPQRGDIVVFFSPSDRTRLVKRVIGLPGDEIALQNSRLFINGDMLRYDQLDQDSFPQIPKDERSSHLFFSEHLADVIYPVMYSSSFSPPGSFRPFVIPEDKYFMLGDNRDNSMDSRYFGLVDRSQIVGRVLAVVISRDGNFLHPRWDRFLTKLE